jgi:hypothetical protein
VDSLVFVSCLWEEEEEEESVSDFLRRAAEWD